MQRRLGLLGQGKVCSALFPVKSEIPLGLQQAMPVDLETQVWRAGPKHRLARSVWGSLAHRFSICGCARASTHIKDMEE